MKQICITTSSIWINSLIRAEVEPAQALPYLTELASNLCPHDDWQKFAAINVCRDATSFNGWLIKAIETFTSNQPRDILHFGLFNPIYKDKEGQYVTLSIYLTPKKNQSFDQWGTESDSSQFHYYDSEVLDNIYSYAYGRPQSLGNSAEFLLGLGYASSLVLYAAQSFGLQLLATSTSQCDITIGFDGGEIETLGTVTRSGFQPKSRVN
ncbi:hypothetical protein GO986_03790 [Deinococcus sp. HMF7620]|uniref:Uncharacterized protein n=1 Tax=Deinococcus arboris TaxID=2682977 RepID=A0A7C9M6U7_9DEIO|nr:hypothetical protein [Deinococcus arboris]MVN85883.1 hypothetical protein [Deinococcus arboris]